MSKQNKWVIHHRTQCIGCGNCVAVCSKYWQMNESDGRADLQQGVHIKNEIFKRKLDSEDQEANELAQALCPVGIIKLE